MSWGNTPLSITFSLEKTVAGWIFRLLQAQKNFLLCETNVLIEAVAQNIDLLLAFPGEMKYIFMCVRKITNTHRQLEAKPFLGVDYILRFVSESDVTYLTF